MNLKERREHKGLGRQHGRSKAGVVAGRRDGSRPFEFLAFFVVEEDKIGSEWIAKLTARTND